MNDKFHSPAEPNKAKLWENFVVFIVSLFKKLLPPLPAKCFNYILFYYPHT